MNRGQEEQIGRAVFIQPNSGLVAGMGVQGLDLPQEDAISYICMGLSLIHNGVVAVMDVRRVYTV